MKWKKIQKLPPEKLLSMSATKNYVVLGASSSIGLPVCKAILNDGHRVIAHVNSRNKELVTLCEQFPYQLRILRKNFLDEDFIFEDKTFVNLDAVHGILHCPSLPLEIKSTLKTKWSEIDNNMKVQIKSLHALILCLSKLKLLNKTRLVVINSEVSTITSPPKGFLSYAIPKIALDAFCRLIGNEFNNKIIVNQISPSMFESNLISNVPTFVKEQNSVGALRPEVEILNLVYYLLFEATENEINQNLSISSDL